jgi:hypothetical protein
MIPGRDASIEPWRANPKPTLGRFAKTPQWFLPVLGFLLMTVRF